MEKNNLSIVSLVVSVATLILVAYVAFFGTSAELTKIEALKVWGMENYKLVQEIYNSPEFAKTQSDSLKQAVAQFQGWAADGANPSAPTDTTNPSAPSDQQAGADGFTRGTLTSDQIASVTEGAVYNGKESASIVLIEYSDIECPFCQRHFSSNTVDSIINKYPDAVKTVFKNFPLSFHATAQKAAEWVECATLQDKRSEFVKASFDAAIASSDKKPSKEVLLAVAKDIKLDEAAFSKCLDSGETADIVKSQMNEGSSLFGVTGTPGNVLLNTKTGKYVVVAGAYPASEFDALVTEIQ